MIISQQQIEKFQSLDQEFKALIAKRANLFNELFSPGTFVYWFHHGHIQTGKVTYCRCYNDFLDMMVENDKTGRIVKVTAYEISWEHMKSQAESFNELVDGLDYEMQQMQHALQVR